MKAYNLNTQAPERLSDAYWGYHLILDCQQCDTSKITHADTIRAFAKRLVSKINMKAFGEPIVEHFATESLKTGGYSLVQLIETSSITGHFIDANGDAYLDIFSCQYFDTNEAQQVVRDFFNPSQIKVTYLTRQA